MAWDSPVRDLSGKFQFTMIEDYTLEIFTPPCDPGADRFSVRAQLPVDISEVLPYLNASLRGALYYPEAKCLTWKKDGHTIAFHPYEIDISNVEERKIAEEEIAKLVALVNRTWERRAELTPEFGTRPRLTPMAVFNLLPKTNCRECGEQTCYSFALKLTASLVKITDCPPLFTPEFSEKLAALQSLVSDSLGEG
jgi:ArsR family metal-binding transcriptional regulator